METVKWSVVLSILITNSSVFLGFYLKVSIPFRMIIIYHYLLIHQITVNLIINFGNTYYKK